MAKKKDKKEEIKEEVIIPEDNMEHNDVPAIKEENVSKPISKPEFVTVCSALPHAHDFPLPDGRTLRVNGRPESKFVGPNGVPLEGNQYGDTYGVKAEDWEYIINPNNYGKIPFIANRIMFAVPNEDALIHKKKSLANLRSGLEQIDPTKTLTQPKPDKE